MRRREGMSAEVEGWEANIRIREGMRNKDGSGEGNMRIRYEGLGESEGTEMEMGV